MNFKPVLRHPKKRIIMKMKIQSSARRRQENEKKSEKIKIAKQNSASDAPENSRKFPEKQTG